MEKKIIQVKLTIKAGTKQSDIVRSMADIRILGLEHASDDGLIGKKAYLSLHNLLQDLDSHFIVDENGDKFGFTVKEKGYFPMNNVQSPYTGFSVHADEILEKDGSICVWVYGQMDI